MKKITRYGIQVLKWATIVALSVWIGLSAFLYFNRDDLIAQISTKIKETTHGDVSIGNFSAGFLRTFPFLAIEFSDISIHDSLWKHHHRDFLKAKKIYLRFNPLTLFSGHPRINKLIAEDGIIHVFTDNSGYSNHYLFSPKSGINKAERKKVDYPVIVLKQMRLLYTNAERNKAFDVHSSRSRIDIESKESYLAILIKAKLEIGGLAFNTNKGSYLKNKLLEGNLRLIYKKATKEMRLSNQPVNIDHYPFNLDGSFSLDSASRDFMLSLKTKNINFNKALLLLPEKLQAKLGKYTIEKPINLQVDINRKIQKGSKPKIDVMADIRNSTISAPFGRFTQCDFKGYYTNEYNPNEPGSDENSALRLTSFIGTWEGTPLKSKQIKITNLKRPFLECDLLSDFDMVSLNELAGSNTLRFNGGRGHIDIVYKGMVKEGDSSASGIVGKLLLENTTIRYLPRNFTLSHCSGAINFQDKNLQVDKLNTTIGNSKLTMNGSIENFLSLLGSSPEKLSIRWNVYSPRLFLEDFKAFLGKRSVAGQKVRKGKFQVAAAKIDRMFLDGDVSLTIESPGVSYKKFKATGVKAIVFLLPTQAVLKNIFFHHAGGNINMTGLIQNKGSINSVKLNARLNHLWIPDLFYAFDNFGQDALTRENLSGTLSAAVNIQTSITDQAKMNRNSTAGTIDFLIENGELNHFEPLQKIQQTAFKKQNFSEVRFAELKNKLQIKGSAFTFDKMEIRSSALTMFVQGVYDTERGTNMSIQLPVRSLLKNNAETDLTDAGKRGAGIRIRLRAQTGEDGKLKISWDPFRKALKKKN